MNFYAAKMRLRSLFRRAAVDRELSEEMQFHLDAKVDELIAQGVPEAEARRMARREFGSVTLHEDACRDQRRMNALDALWQDVRYSARALRRTPGFTAIAIASLALGIGATSALFSIVDVAVLHPVPLANAARLVWLQEYGPDRQESNGNPQRLRDWQSLSAFDGVAGFYGEGVVLTGEGDPKRLEGLRYMGPLAEVLEARTQMGRLPSADETFTLALTDAAWRKTFAADPRMVGHSLRLGSKSYEVVGVLNADVRYPDDVAFWAPMPRELQGTSRQAGFLSQAARLRPGLSLAQAQAQANAVATRLGHDYASTDRGRSVHLESLAQHVAQPARTALLLFFGAALGVLLIACVNVAGLLLARGLNRQREASIRVALGAGRSRLLRLFLAEALLLAAAGCAAGIGLAWIGLDALKLALPEDTPRLADAAIGIRVVLFGVGLGLVCAVLCGLAPAWRAAAQAAGVGMKERGSRSPLRSALVVAQMALSLMLLIVSGLLVNSFLHMKLTPLGFDPQRAYSFQVAYPWDTDDAVIANTARQVLERLSAMPGTQAAGVVDRLPLHGGTQSRPVLVSGLELPPELREREIGWRMASEGYFAAAGIPVLAGGLFRGVHECVVSAQLAKSLFGAADPIGRQIASRPRAGKAPTWFRIVGVVGNTRQRPTDPSPAMELYIPWGADYWPILNFVVRTNVPLGIAQVRPRVPGAVIDSVQSLDNLTAQTRSTSRTRAILAGSLAMVALLLCAIGLFALLAHETARRTQEYGIRVALGAEPGELARSAIGNSLRLAAGGLAIGLGAALALSRGLKSLLFEVQGTDAATYALACLLLVAVALAASIVPALRAARVDPLTALRHD